MNEIPSTQVNRANLIGDHSAAERVARAALRERERSAKAAHDQAVARATEVRELAREARDSAHAAYTVALTVHEHADTRAAWQTLLLTNHVLNALDKDVIAAITAQY